MKRLPLLLLSVLFIASCATPSQRGQQLVGEALTALGGADAMVRVRSLGVKGTARFWEPEQSSVPGGEARLAADATFEARGDFVTHAMRVDWVKKFQYPAPRTFTYSEIVTPAAGYVIGRDANNLNQQAAKMKPTAHAMSGLRLAATQRELRRASPSLLLDMRNHPDRVTALADIAVGGVTYPAAGYKVGNHEYIVMFDPQTKLPARIRTFDYDGVWGDVNYDLVLADWRMMDGVRMAASQKYELNGQLVIDIRITDVTVNPRIAAETFEPPAAIKAGAARPATGYVPYQWVLRRQFIGVYMDSDHSSFDHRAGSGLRLAELAPGVEHQVGGTHHSLIVAMGDYLIVFDAPVSDWQSNWTIAAAKEKYPGKPVRYLVLTHHHMDHIGGLRAYLAQGATLVVGAGAAAHYRRVLAAPYSRNPDLAERDLSRTQIIEVADRHVISDGKREVSAHLIENPHSASALIGYVADARIGFITDIWSPGPPLPGKITSPLLAVVNATKKAGIAPLRFAGGHGFAADFAPLAALAAQ